MATSVTVSFVKQKLVEMSLHSHPYWKNSTVKDHEYLNFLLDESGRSSSITIPTTMEATYTKCHG